jgi:hypothetical protein
MIDMDIYVKFIVTGRLIACSLFFQRQGRLFDLTYVFANTWREDMHVCVHELRRADRLI